MGKAKKLTYGMAFVWFVVAVTAVGVILAVAGAARDVLEDWNDP